MMICSHSRKSFRLLVDLFCPSAITNRRDIRSETAYDPFIIGSISDQASAGERFIALPPGQHGETVMVDIPPIFHTGAFDADTVRIMTHAFDNCRETIPDTHDRAETEQAMAKLIIEFVRRGVRDPKELCREAQRELGISH
jgi:hypothetical protein